MKQLVSIAERVARRVTGSRMRMTYEVVGTKVLIAVVNELGYKRGFFDDLEREASRLNDKMDRVKFALRLFDVKEGRMVFGSRGGVYLAVHHTIVTDGGEELQSAIDVLESVGFEER